MLIMYPRTGWFHLLVVISLIVDIQLAASQCEHSNVMECLTGKRAHITEDDDFCKELDIFKLQVDQCNAPDKLTQCSDGEKIEVQFEVTNIKKEADEKCMSTTSTTTTTTTTTTPLPDYCDEFGATGFSHNESYYRSRDRQTRYGVDLMLWTSQDLIDCFFKDESLIRCQVYKLSFYRELIPHLKFAHLFDCQLNIEETTVTRHNKQSDCNLWSWLTCHDSLLSALPGIDPVKEGFDLNKIIKFNVPDVTRELAQNRDNCSQYNDVKWSKITNCRSSLSDKCSMLRVPRRDPLWSGVIYLMYEIKTNIYDKMTTLMAIEDICSDACDNIMSKINMIDNKCKKDAGAETATTIIAKFNKKEDFKTDCSYLGTMKNCLKNTIIGNCSFLEQSVVNNLHQENVWILAFSICKIDLDINSDGKCAAEQNNANRILSDCSFQENPNNRNNLLDGKDFCFYLQQTTNCYDMNMAHCSALERKYWLAELPLVATANQMLPDCTVAHETYGNAIVKTINETTCNMESWVSCLGDLWSALDVTNQDNKLSLEGFKALLRLAWNVGNKEEQNERCGKMESLDWDQIEQCVEGLSLTCQYPMLTLPDRFQHDLQLRDPFDFGKLKSFVNTVCQKDCKDVNVEEKFKECIDVEQDSEILTSYPQDIIASSYRNVYEKKKCEDVQFVKECIEYFLDPNKCVLFRNVVVKTEAILDAVELCKTTRPPPVNTNNNNNFSSIGNTVITSVVLVLLSAISAFVVYP
ncbi:hypothetical protein LSH36_908g00037 [Paralvinella palmiformis]|uniref:Uncharacterized protein n=1 Tax=Paralvinella palmiformis TaxID=53620 RepID=A0AAD9IYV4_9ANNE|nr:hypothetical protein LSH36_908g00037 [Paralvinella palmiformis]